MAAQILCSELLQTERQHLTLAVCCYPWLCKNFGLLNWLGWVGDGYKALLESTQSYFL